MNGRGWDKPKGKGKLLPQLNKAQRQELVTWGKASGVVIMDPDTVASFIACVRRRDGSLHFTTIVGGTGNVTVRDALLLADIALRTSGETKA